MYSVHVQYIIYYLCVNFFFTAKKFQDGFQYISIFVCHCLINHLPYDLRTVSNAAACSVNAIGFTLHGVKFTCIITAQTHLHVIESKMPDRDAILWTAFGV